MSGRLGSVQRSFYPDERRSVVEYLTRAGESQRRSDSAMEILKVATQVNPLFISAFIS